MATVLADRLPGIIIPPDVDTYDTSQVTSLMLAAYHGNNEIVLALLMENEQCIMSRNVFGQTALHYAIDNGQINVIDTLVGYEADLSEVDSNGQNILHRCAQHGFCHKVETCLNIGINIDICNRNGDTALTIAAQRGNLEMVKLLVNGGSDISIRNNDGLNATDCSFCNNHEEVKAFLLNSKLEPIDHMLEHIMMRECSSGNTESVRNLVNAYGVAIVNFRNDCFTYYSPLHVACKNGCLELAQLLKENGANLNSRNHISDTPLMSSSINNETDIVEWLIAQGVKMNDRNCFNESALHVAAIKGHMHMVKLLAENGTFLNFHMTKGSTAVHLAVQEHHLDILDYLLNKGALPDVTEDDGVTPLLCAVDLKNMGMVQCLIKYGASVNKCDHDINTPLSVAVNRKSLDMVRYLIEKGADVNITDKNGYSPKDAAWYCGYYDIAIYLTNVTQSEVDLDERFYKTVQNAQEYIFQMCKTGKGTKNQLDNFIRAGANVNSIDIDGRTPLIIATQSSSKECVQWLLEKTVCVFTKDKQSFTAIQYAVENEDIDLLGLLLQKASHESVNYEQTEQVLESAIKHCIKLKSHASVCITNMLLKNFASRKLNGNCMFTLLNTCIVFENVAIAQLLFNYHLSFDSFEPSIVTITCMSSNIDMLQCLVKYMSDSKHRHSYVKVAVRFCLANQLDQALCTVTHQSFNAQEIFWINNQNIWCGSESNAFKVTMEFVAGKGLDIDAQNISGCTFLMYAASMGMNEAMKFILWKGGDMFLLNKDRKDTLGLALNAGHYETAMLITDKSLVTSGILDTNIHIIHKVDKYTVLRN